MEAKYGLPECVAFCARCVISNQRPSSAVEFAHTADSHKSTIAFDEDGVCSACRVAERKRSIDWDERKRELQDLCDQHRSAHGFDCIVPGSGGKDSFYAAHRLIHDFGMHPLLVTWPPNLYTEWGYRNYTRWKELAPQICYAPAGKTHRLLTRLAVENLFHPFQAFMLGQKTLAPRIAELTGIALCFYGESEAEYGNAIAESEVPLRDAAYFARTDAIHLGGVSVADLKSVHDVTQAELEPYLPLADASGIEVHYLGYYLPWTPQENYYYAVDHGGFECSPDRQPGTYSKYNSIDDKIDDFHYWTTFQKFGIGRATYDAAQEIRNGHITREEGVALVHRFDGEYPERFEREINDYLSVEGFPPMTRERWMMLAERFRSPHLFDGDKLRYRVA